MFFQSLLQRMERKDWPSEEEVKREKRETGKKSGVDDSILMQARGSLLLSLLLR